MEEKLKEKFPCRSEEIDNLINQLGYADEAYPAAIYIYGHSGTGKSSIVKEFLNEMSKESFKGVLINCVECYSTKILAENILSELSPSKGEGGKFDNMKDFIEELQRWNEPGVKRPDGFVIAIDNAERLRDMDANVLPVLLRLPELVGLNICVVLISQLSFEKFYPKSGLPEVMQIFFPQYSKGETLRILSKDFENTKNLIIVRLNTSCKDSEDLKKKTEKLEAITKDFFNNYLNLFLSVFFKACRDVPELKITARKCFLTYVEPVLDGSIAASDASRLWRNISASLKTALSQVYMRVDLSDNTTASNSLNPNENALLDQSVRQMALSLELPYYGKYLLIAAFLASYNSPKQDKRLFVKHHGKQKKRLQTINANAKTSDKMATSLGPKSFSIDRLLAIFYAILEEKVGLTCNLLAQISTLVHLKLLSFVSGENNVMDGSARLQCTVSLEFVLQIGKNVGFNVRQYLCDFM